MFYNYPSNYYSPAPNLVQSAPTQQVVRVNGENGARAYQIAPNSSALLLDESNPLVWLVQTDGAGYKTVTPFKIEPYQQEPAPDYSTLEQRIAKLEEAILNGKSYSNSAE